MCLFSKLRMAAALVLGGVNGCLQKICGSLLPIGLDPGLALYVHMIRSFSFICSLSRYEMYNVVEDTCVDCFVFL